MKKFTALCVIILLLRVSMEFGYRAGFEDAWNVRFVEAPEYLRNGPVYDSFEDDSADISIETDELILMNSQ